MAFVLAEMARHHGLQAWPPTEVNSAQRPSSGTMACGSASVFAPSPCDWVGLPSRPQARTDVPACTLQYP